MAHLEIKPPELAINALYNVGNVMAVTLVLNVLIVIRVTINYKMDAMINVRLDIMVINQTEPVKVS